MGSATLAEAIKGTREEAQQIIEDFYKEFPKVKKWIDDTQINARKNGYVEDAWGRRRRLPDIQLPKYEVSLKDATKSFNPLLHITKSLTSTQEKTIKRYQQALNSAKSWRDVDKIKKEAEKDNISIKDNGGYISLAERQCVNARVQGGAATMSKKAMWAVYKDKQMNDMDFRILIAVHDELIGECPEIYKDAVADRLCEIMKHAADDVANVPFKCDPTIEAVWYESDYASVLCKEYKDLQKDNSDEEALQILTQRHCECLPIQIKKFLGIS